MRLWRFACSASLDITQSAINAKQMRTAPTFMRPGRGFRVLFSTESQSVVEHKKI
jgi:hypothetical protein